MRISVKHTNDTLAFGFNPGCLEWVGDKNIAVLSDVPSKKFKRITIHISTLHAQQMHSIQHGRTAKASAVRRLDRAVMHGQARSCTVVLAHARSCHGKSPVPARVGSSLKYSIHLADVKFVGSRAMLGSRTRSRFPWDL